MSTEANDDHPLINYANRPYARIDGKIWLNCPRPRITVPEYIEGRARGTLELLNGDMCRRQVYFRTGTRPIEWFFADDPTKTTIKSDQP